MQLSMEFVESKLSLSSGGHTQFDWEPHWPILRAFNVENLAVRDDSLKDKFH